MRLIVDSDGGIDDAAALAWLIAQPGVELAAVTAVGGNCDVGQAARNLRIVLEACGAPDVPVHVGADPSPDHPPIARPVMIHGEDGLGDVGLTDPAVGAVDAAAVQVLVSELHRGASLLALGPLTNVAAAVLADPSAAAACAGFTFMGGSAGVGGNAMPLGEANVVHDPAAAAAAFAAAWAVPPVMVGLDVTHRATLTAVEFDVISARRTAAAAFLDAPLAFYRRRSGTFCAPGETPVHDLLAAMAAVDPAYVGTELLPVAVDTAGGPAWGTTVVDQRVRAWRRVGQLGPSELPAADAVVRGNAPVTGSPLAVGLTADVERFRASVTLLAGG